MAKNSEYWTRRARADKLKVIKRGENGIKDLKRLLIVNKKDVENQIKAFYDKYGEDMFEQLSFVELRKYKENLKKTVKDNPKDLFMAKRLREDAPKYKIDRLRALDTQLQSQISYITSRQQAGIATTLEDVGKYSNILVAKSIKDGLGLTFNTLSQRKLNQIINQTWVGRKNWSARIWADRDKVGRVLSKTLKTGAVQGVSLQEMARTVKNSLNSSFYDAFRLIRTESAHIDGQVRLLAMQEAEAEGLATQYKYDAFIDSRTSKVCQDLNGEIIDIKDAKVGENYPPMHPNCRSVAVMLPIE